MPLHPFRSLRNWLQNRRSIRKPEFDYNQALRRLIYFLLLGCFYALAYALSSWHSGVWTVLGTLSVALMTAGAAMSVGGLLGFLFGVPHTRDNPQSDSDSKTKEGESKTKADTSATTYRPNTSLEQISDWLTKMLVGVGLVEVKAIPPQLARLAAFIALGLGNNDQARVFALSLSAYFGLGGFVFGFLWARLYLPKWFREADKVEQLEKKISHLEANSRALALASHQISEAEEEPLEGEQSLAEAFKAASAETRERIFGMAKETFEQRKGESDATVEAIARRIIPVVEALVENDPGELDHRYHSLLALLLRRLPDKHDAVIREVEKAIGIRNKLKRKGWKWYEFQRARALIENDPNSAKNQLSDQDLVAKIRTDLRVAFDDRDWKRWYDNHEAVRDWMKLNLGISDSATKP
jgi:hypothetical protein